MHKCKRTHSLQVSVQRPRQVLRPERERELDVGGPAQQQHDLPLHGKWTKLIANIFNKPSTL